MNVAIDTSALFALVDRDDRAHDDARRWLASNSTERLVSNNYVVVEALALIERRHGRAAALALRSAVLPLVEVSWVDPDQHERALDAHFASGRGSSFVDQASFIVMRDAGIDTAFAFDDDFRHAGFTVVP